MLALKLEDWTSQVFSQGVGGGWKDGPIVYRVEGKVSLGESLLHFLVIEAPSRFAIPLYTKNEHFLRLLSITL